MNPEDFESLKRGMSEAVGIKNKQQAAEALEDFQNCWFRNTAGHVHCITEILEPETVTTIESALKSVIGAGEQTVGIEGLEQIDMDMDVLKDCIPNRQDREKFLTPIHNRVKELVRKVKT